MSGTQAVFDFDSTLQAPRRSFRLPKRGIITLRSGRRVRLNREFTGAFNGDTLSTLFDALAPRDSSGAPMRRRWEEEQRQGVITNEELLRRQVEAVLLQVSVEDAIDLAARMLKPMRGAQHFMRALGQSDVEVVIASNGCDRLQAGLMTAYFPETPFQMFANILEGTQQRTLHSDAGVDKARVVNEQEHPLLFCGDSTNDATGALATANRGGLVFSLGDTLSTWCEEHLPPHRWVRVRDFYQALPILRHRVLPKVVA